MSTNHDHESQIAPPTILEAAALPETGYTLGAGEVVEVSTGHTDFSAQGQIDFNGWSKPYKSMLGIRMGGDNTYADIEVFAVPDDAANPTSGLTYVRLTNPQTANVYPWPRPVYPDGGVIGRGQPEYRGLPDTVSREHIRLSTDSVGKVRVENLHPTNKTVLFNTIPTEQPKPPKEPKEMAATRAIDPLTGANVAGPVVSASRSNVLVDPKSGHESPMPGKDVQPEDEAARQARRRRMAQNSKVMRLPLKY